MRPVTAPGHRRDEVGETVGVTVRGGPQRLEQASMLVGPGDGAPALREAAPRAGDDLPRVGFPEAEGAGDVAIRVAEGFTKDVRGALGRRQRLEQDADAVRQRFVSFQCLARREIRINGLGCPRRRLRLAPREIVRFWENASGVKL